MARPVVINLTLSATSANAVCASQKPAAGGSQALVINGALAASGVATLPVPQHLSITSDADDHARTFLVTGTDRYGQSITKSVGGPNGATVTVDLSFATVTGVSVDDNTAGNITVGITDAGESKWVPVDRYVDSFNLAIAGVHSGTVNWTIQHTYDDVLATGFQESGATAFSHTSLVNKANTDADGAYTSQISAWRLKINSGTGTVTATALQTGPGC